MCTACLPHIAVEADGGYRHADTSDLRWCETRDHKKPRAEPHQFARGGRARRRCVDYAVECARGTPEVGRLRVRSTRVGGVPACKRLMSYSFRVCTGYFVPMLS